jgi:hypothetical protein
LVLDHFHANEVCTVLAFDFRVVELFAIALDVDLERYFVDRVPVADMDDTAFRNRRSLPRDGTNAQMHPQHPGNVGVEVVDRIGPGDVIAHCGRGIAFQVCQVDVVEEALCSADSKSLFLGRVGWASLLDLCFRAR